MRRIAAVLLAAALPWGCRDFFERDISRSAVPVIAPEDGAAVGGPRVGFLWENLPGAARYELTVVTRSFGRGGSAVCDTLVEPDSIALHTGVWLTLAPGTYQWRVVAANGAYASLPETRTFTVNGEDAP